MHVSDPTQIIRELMPLAATMGIRADVYAPDQVVLSLDWAPSLCTAAGILHGGAVMALADSAGAACTILNLPEGAAGTTTIESKTNFLGAVRSGSVSATSTVLHRGGTTIVVETLVRDQAGKLVAKVTQTQLVLRPR
jgi:1,4-dihydroxy-2-naphthoyl-CoA hydrolase